MKQSERQREQEEERERERELSLHKMIFSLNPMVKSLMNIEISYHSLCTLLQYILGTAHPVAMLCEGVEELLSVNCPQLKQTK